MRNYSARLVAVVIALIASAGLTAPAAAEGTITINIKNETSVRVNISRVKLVLEDGTILKFVFDPPLNIPSGARGNITVEKPQVAVAKFGIESDQCSGFTAGVACDQGQIPCADGFINVVHAECSAAAIPTASEWGLIILALLLVTAGTLSLRRVAVEGPAAIA